MRGPMASDNYAAEANQLSWRKTSKENVLAHRTLERHVNPNNTSLVVDALIKANKDFVCCFSESPPRLWQRGYMVRRRWIIS